MHAPCQYGEFITNAVETPAFTLSDFSEQDLSPSVVVFQEKIINEHPETIERFYAGFNQVIDEFETTPREEIVDVALTSALEFFFPGIVRSELPDGAEEFLAEFIIPDFPQPRNLDEREFVQVVNWALDKNYLSQPLPFSSIYNSEFIFQ